MTFSASLAFTLFVGAARYDATPEQVSMLKAQVVPLLDGYKETGDETAVREAVHRIMGPQWKPNADFRRTIIEVQNASLATSTARLRAAGFAPGTRARPWPPRGSVEALGVGLPASAQSGSLGGAAHDRVEGGLGHAEEAHE
jgi:hypothetical protein